MGWVCPICNGLANYTIRCPDCGSQMEAGSAVQDYFDAYSPYLDKRIIRQADGVEHNRCVHLFYCPNCNEDKRVIINEIQM
ncbi:MAG: hypothetical protein ACOCG5_02690 [Candidatus Alkaliphilus sp. MAG34]|nr:hypothetical protein [Clostridiales bacterium]